MGRLDKLAQVERLGSMESQLPLREHRLRAGISLESISETSKISRRFLEAIEQANYDELPGGVFSTSYIRQYAACTGYDAELILKHYRDSRGEPTPSRPVASETTAVVAPRWVKFLSFG